MQDPEAGRRAREGISTSGQWNRTSRQVSKCLSKLIGKNQMRWTRLKNEAKCVRQWCQPLLTPPGGLPPPATQEERWAERGGARPLPVGPGHGGPAFQ